MKTKEREPMPTEDFYHDLFVGGYFKPEEFLLHQYDIFAVNDAIITIENYRKTLEQNNLIEAI